VDWIFLELRETTGAPNTATQDSVISRQVVFLKNNGEVVDLEGKNIIPTRAPVYDNLHAVIWHRNHLGIMSANPLVEIGGLFLYDFSDESEKVFGGTNGHKELVPGLWGMIASDGDANFQIDNKDKNDIWLLQLGNDGYYEGDFDMNGTVDVQDRIIWELNSGKAGKVQE